MPLLRPLLIATVLLASGQSMAQQAALGRLFFTPDQRAALDRQRQFSQASASDDKGATLTINGVVRRSSGRDSTWINGNLTPGEVSGNLNRALGEQGDLLRGGVLTINPRGTQKANSR